MKILIIEDEKELRQTIGEFLSKENYLVEFATDYISGSEKISMYSYDCILLDIMMPGGTGIDLLKTLRNQGKNDPVIVISAKDSLEDKVLGLELGADDYLPKPFHLAELLARVKSAIRRNHQQVDHQVAYKNISIFTDLRQVFVKGSELHLNRKEYDMLYYFVIRPQKLLEKTMLAESIWGDYIDQADNLDFIYSQIKNLRKKLKDSGADADIQAVYGVGYKLI